MIRYKQIQFEEVQAIAFDSKTLDAQALLLQDILKRVKLIKQNENVSEDRIIFLENTKTGEIRMEIV